MELITVINCRSFVTRAHFNISFFYKQIIDK